MKKFVRVTQRNPCPICNRQRWCSFTADGEAVWCMSTGERGVGALVKLGTPVEIRAKEEQRPVSREWLVQLYTDLRSECGDLHDFAMNELSYRLGVARSALDELGFVYDWIFDRFLHPAYNAHGELVGLHTRHWSGQKKYIRGSKAGLLIAKGRDYHGKPLLAVEGASDVAAALTMRFNAVGRPGCATCMPMLVEFVKKVEPSVVVIWADVDNSGVGVATGLKLRGMLDEAGIDTRFTEAKLKDLRTDFVCNPAATLRRAWQATQQCR